MNINEYAHSIPYKLTRLEKVKRCLEKGFTDVEITTHFQITKDTLKMYKVSIKNGENSVYVK